MKRYMLLRDNHESGPFSFAELRDMKLRQNDLIWAEGESTNWKYPEEIEELKPMITLEKAPSPAGRSGRKPEHIFVALPAGVNAANRSRNQQPAAAEETTALKKYEPLKEAYRESEAGKEFWNKRVVRDRHPLINLTLVFAGLLAGAALLKNMVDQFGDASEDQVPVAIASVAAQKPEAVPDGPAAPRTETAVAPAVRSKEPAMIQARTLKPLAKMERPLDLSRVVQVKSNDYKVGLFGGINNLQLTVFNNSPQPIEKVVVVVDYLKPSGTIVSSSEHEIRLIGPYRSQTLQVPPSKRGVKVNFHVKYVEGRKQKAALKHI